MKTEAFHGKSARRFHVFFPLSLSCLPVQYYLLFYLNQALHTFVVFLITQTAMKRSNSKAKSTDVISTGERHLELPATSQIIPRKKISSRRLINNFHTSVNELRIRQLVCSIKYTYCIFFHFLLIFLNSCLILWRTHFGAEI